MSATTAWLSLSELAAEAAEDGDEWGPDLDDWCVWCGGIRLTHDSLIGLDEWCAWCLGSGWRGGPILLAAMTLRSESSAPVRNEGEG